MSDLKVLVAESDAQILFAFSKILENEGCICYKSSNVADALNKIQRGKPNAVFLDISRSESDYDKIFEKITGEKLTMPLIIVTSHTTDKLRQLAANVGAMEVFEKPLTLKEIRGILEKIKKEII